MDRKFLEELGVDAAIVDAVLEEHGKAMEAARSWEEKYTQAVAAHQQQVDTLRFENTVEKAITAAGGRSIKAITALLDTEVLRKAEDPAAAAAAAVAALKQDSAYLFAPPVPPPFAPGTGTGGFTEPQPQNLADALKERFAR